LNRTENMLLFPSMYRSDRIMGFSTFVGLVPLAQAYHGSKLIAPGAARAKVASSGPAERL